jgi:hypothetical protein
MQNETIEIENAIIKIGTLLALGFGDAGTFKYNFFTF